MKRMLNRMKRMSKRMLATLLVMLMVFSMDGVMVMAQSISENGMAESISENSAVLQESNMEIESDRLVFQNSQYQILGENTWQGAKKMCEAVGGHMVTINSEEEQNFVFSMVRQHYINRNSYACWIGGYESGGWHWVTDEEFKYTNWRRGEPSGGEPYLMMAEGGVWNDGFYGVFLVICEWDISGACLLENDLMEKVSLYTSTDGSVYTKAFTNLTTRLENGNYTQEEKYRIMNQFWTGLGYTDIEEGISYCYDSTEARRAYDYMVTNDSYGAYQYWEWLNCTKDGNVARGLLLADDLIFNNGISQYADVNTYLTAETHSIKAYKSMLLDFMDHDEKKIKFLTYADNLNKLASGITDASNTSLLNNYFKKMNNAKTMEEAKEIYGNYVDEIKIEIKKNNKSGNIIVQNLSGYKEIKKITNNTELIIDAFSCGIEDLSYFALLETRLEMISYYESFLDSIIAGQDVLPFDMVVAAAQLKNELLQNSTVAYLHKLSARLLDFVASDHVLDLKGYLGDKLGVGSATTLGGAIATIELGALIVDIGTGIGETVDASRCVEAYAYLGMYYSNLLRQCKNDFLENKTIENAWKFYDTYQLLFRIRYMGENAYLEMNKAQGIIGTIIKSCNWNFFRIKDKEAFVRETMAYLNNHCVFAVKGFSDKGNEHYYPQKAIIKCPVDVEIYDENGTLLYTLYDKKEIDESTGDGRFLCKYDSALGEFVKVIYLNDDKQYRFLIKGVDVGNVTLETARNDGEKVEIVQISGLPIESGGIITLNTEMNKYDVDKDGDGKKEVTGNLSEAKKDERILISKIELSEESLRMNIGDKIALGATITPSNATFSELEWNSSNPEIVEVYCGGVYAKGQGTATVSAKSQDGSNLVVNCNVVVENDKETDEKEDDDNSNTLPDDGSSNASDDKPNNNPDDGSSNVPDDNTNTLPDELDTWKTMSGTEGFVCRLYNIALGREAEEKGFREWTQKLNSQENTAAEVAQGFIFSEEFLNKEYNDTQFVKMLYRTMFGREADQGGLSGWLSDLENGMSREYVFQGFAESQEFTNLCDSYHVKRGSVTLSAYRDKNKGATGFIARLYTKMLGRKYEDKGLEYWCKEYLTGKQSIEQIATNGFLHSEELTNQNLSDEEFVTRMYETFLNREPEEAGLRDWVGRLQSGKTTRDKLVYGFTNSQEFGNIKAAYGLK